MGSKELKRYWFVVEDSNKNKLVLNNADIFFLTANVTAKKRAQLEVNDEFEVYSDSGLTETLRILFKTFDKNNRGRGKKRCEQFMSEDDLHTAIEEDLTTLPLDSTQSETESEDEIKQRPKLIAKKIKAKKKEAVLMDKNKMSKDLEQFMAKSMKSVDKKLIKMEGLVAEVIKEFIELEKSNPKPEPKQVSFEERLKECFKNKTVNLEVKKVTSPPRENYPYIPKHLPKVSPEYIFASDDNDELKFYVKEMSQDSNLTVYILFNDDSHDRRIHLNLEANKFTLIQGLNQLVDAYNLQVTSQLQTLLKPILWKEDGLGLRYCNFTDIICADEKFFIFLVIKSNVVFRENNYYFVGRPQKTIVDILQSNAELQQLFESLNTISIESSVSVGSVFSITLPLPTHA